MLPTGAPSPLWQISVRRALGLSVADYGIKLQENEGLIKVKSLMQNYSARLNNLNPEIALLAVFFFLM